MHAVQILTSHGRRRLSAAAAGAVLALLAAGCAGGDGSSRTDSQDRLTPQAALVAAVAQAEELTSSRFLLSTSSTIGGTTTEFTGEGAFDYADSLGEMTFTLPGGAGTLHQRVLGDVMYMQLPTEPDVFYELRLSDLVDTSLAGTIDPASGLKALRGANDDVVEVGQEDVRGARTTHYRGTLDMAKALESLKGPLQDQLEQTLGSGELSQAPFDAWIDDEGRLRQFVQTLTIPMGSSSFEVATRLELYDFGIEVDVTPPPAGQVRDGGPLLDSLGAGRPS